MLSCPNCNSRLNRVQTPHGFMYSCASCSGRSVTVPVLRRNSSEEFLKSLLVAERENGRVSTRRCPFCSRPMIACRVNVPDGELVLDYCRLCSQVWFDPKEFESVPDHRAWKKKEELSPQAREAMAVFEIEAQKKIRPDKDDGYPDNVWQFIPAVLGFPVKTGAESVDARPWATWGLSAVMVLLFAMLMGTGSLDKAAWQCGFIPAQWYRLGGLTLLTSFFLHGGIWHIVSNLYFFIIFGDNAEDHLGMGKFLLLLLASHLAGLLVHAAMDPRGEIPLIGASGGIAGVLAYYAVMFPHTRLGFLVRYWLYFRWINIPAWFAMLLFVALQFFGAWQQYHGHSDVSSFGHLGGLIVGFIVAILERARSNSARGGSRLSAPAG